MNAVLREYAMREPPQVKKEEERKAAPETKGESDPFQTFWQWFAVGLLLFCWCAEASMCAQRGF